MQVGKKLNSAGASHASGLIGSGKIKDSSSWEAPSADQENNYLKDHSNSELGDWYLGQDPDEDKDNKGRWAFPFTSDFKEVDLAGLKACITRAAQSGYDDIEKRARSLYQAAKKKLGKDEPDDFYPAEARQRQPNKAWLTVREARNEADEPVTEMVISGVIGSSWYDSSGATSKEFRENFNQISRGKKVHVRINSEGGSVQDALEIYNLIQSRKDDVTTFNDGYALSSASVILCAGGRTIAPHSSITMIHEPWSMTMGNEDDHLKAAEMLAKHGDTIAGIYARKTGKSASDMRQMMRDESWFTGAEACTQGLANAMSDDAECPECGHGQCDECDTDDEGNITCCECEETNTAQDWDDAGAQEDSNELNDANRRIAFAALNLSQYHNIPQHVFNMLRPPPAGQRSKPSNDKMNKSLILALLKKHGIEVADNASDEELATALGKLGEKPAAAANGDSETIQALKTQLENERRIRVTAEVRRRGEHRIQNKDMAKWIDMAMKDESGTYEMIEGLNLVRPGGEPIGHQIQVTENRMEAVRKQHPGGRGAKARLEIWRNEWDGLIADARARDMRNGMAQMMPVIRPDGTQGGSQAYPVNANSYSSSLVTQFLLDGAITKLQNRWAPLRVFTRDYSTDRYKPRATGQLKFVTAGGTTQKNASNFESGDSTITNVQIGVDQYTQAFHVTNDELNSGLRMENLVDVNVAAIADQILQTAFSPLNLADFSTDGTGPNAKIIRAPAAFSFSDVSTALGELKKSTIRYVVLDGEYFFRISSAPNVYHLTGVDDGNPTGEGWVAFGIDGCWINTNWTGTHAGAGDQFIRGLVCNPQALGAIAGLPLSPPEGVPGNTLMISSMTVPDVDISIGSYQWFSLATRTLWMSYDLMFGSAKLDVSAAVLITSQ